MSINNGVPLHTPPEADDSDSEELEFTRRRGLRRHRGSILGSNWSIGASGVGVGIGVGVGARVGAGAEVGGLDVPPEAVRRMGRNSHLHHPKMLKSSPKSAYLKDESAAVMEKDMEKRLGIVFGPVSVAPDEDPEVDHSESSVNHDCDDESNDVNGDGDGDGDGDQNEDDNEPGGAVLNANNTKEGKARVVDKSCRRATPEAIPLALSYTTEALIGPPSRPSSRPPPRSPSPIASVAASIITSSTSSTKDIFLDAVEEPSGVPLSPPGVPKPSVEFPTPPPAPRRGSSPQPQTIPTPTRTTHPVLPALNIIPATPQALPPSAEGEKQLGHDNPAPSILTRESISHDPGIPEDVPDINSHNGHDRHDEYSEKYPTRPTLNDVPSNVRDSKLHPWWLPRKQRRNSLDPSLLSSELKHAETNPFDPIKKNKLKRSMTGGGWTMNIKGTRFVVEFVGWRGISELLKRKAKP